MSKLSHLDVLSRYSARDSLRLNDKTALPPAAENMAWECYNKGDEEITFTTCHPDWRKMSFFGLPPAHWAQLHCKPGEWVFLPHRMYVASVPSGSQEIQVVANCGDQMFIGNKLPSAPENRKTRVFQNKK